jgi:hypothetical protein
MEVAEDTLLTAEQRLIEITSEMQFPLAQRLMEFGFQTASARRAAGEGVIVTEEEFDGLMAALAADGLPAEVTADPVVRRYLNWRARIATAQRMDDDGAEADIRAERDLPLTAAIRLLSTTTSQAGLFEAADREATAAARQTAPPSDTLPGR